MKFICFISTHVMHSLRTHRKCGRGGRKREQGAGRGRVEELVDARLEAIKQHSSRHGGGMDRRTHRSQTHTSQAMATTPPSGSSTSRGTAPWAPPRRAGRVWPDPWPASPWVPDLEDPLAMISLGLKVTVRVIKARGPLLVGARRRRRRRRSVVARPRVRPTWSLDSVG